MPDRDRTNDFAFTPDLSSDPDLFAPNLTSNSLTPQSTVWTQAFSCRVIHVKGVMSKVWFGAVFAISGAWPGDLSSIKPTLALAECATQLYLFCKSLQYGNVARCLDRTLQGLEDRACIYSVNTCWSISRKAFRVESDDYVGSPWL